MEMTDRLSTLPHNDQLRVIERAFRKIGLAFGNLMLIKWQGMDMQEVYSGWADDMQELSLGAINRGIDVSKNGQHPPNLGEFIANCKTYSPPKPLAIDHKLTPEQLERNKERIKSMLVTLNKNVVMSDE